MTDPIADMLTRIRNAQMARKSEVYIPFSKIKMAIAEIMQKHGYIKSVEKVENQFAEIKVVLKYNESRLPQIHSLKRVSKAGSRIYVNKDSMKSVLGGRGISIISTSKGLMTNKEARQAGVGGELICEIY